jgi:hypothetical protein
MGNCCSVHKKKPSKLNRPSQAESNAPAAKKKLDLEPKSAGMNELLILHCSASLKSHSQALKQWLYESKPLDSESLSVELKAKRTLAKEELLRSLTSTVPGYSIEEIDFAVTKFESEARGLGDACRWLNSFRSFEICDRLKKNLVSDLARKTSKEAELVLTELAIQASGPYRSKCSEDLQEVMRNSRFYDKSGIKHILKQQTLQERQRLRAERVELEAKLTANSLALEMLSHAVLETETSPKANDDSVYYKDLDIELVDFEDLTDEELEQKQASSIELELNEASSSPEKPLRSPYKSKSLAETSSKLPFQYHELNMQPLASERQPESHPSKESKASNFRVPGSSHLVVLKERISQFRQRIDKKLTSDHLGQDLVQRGRSKMLLITPRRSLNPDENSSFVSYLSSSEV